MRKRRWMLMMAKKKALPLALIILGLISTGAVFGESIWNIISNILGPYKVHVSPETRQLLTIAVSDIPQQVSLGQTISVTLTVENPTSSDVQGYVLINVTSTSDFASNDISLMLRYQNFGGWSGETRFVAVYTMSRGCAYKTETRFTWRSGCRDIADLYIVFNKPGDYELTIAISSN